MGNTITFLIVRIGWAILQWQFDKANKSARARELTELFKQVESDGIVLFNQLGSEMSRQSKTEWKDIEIRGDDKESASKTDVGAS